jgi:hypothetical protein
VIYYKNKDKRENIGRNSGKEYLIKYPIDIDKQMKTWKGPG